MAYRTCSVAVDGRVEDRELLATELRQHGFALLRIQDPEAKCTVARYRADTAALFNQPMSAKSAAVEQINCSGGVTAKYLQAGDGAARALASRREYFALDIADTDIAGTPQTLDATGVGSVMIAMGQLCRTLAAGLLADLALHMGIPEALLQPAPKPAADDAAGRGQPATHSLTAFHYLDGNQQPLANGSANTHVMLPEHYDMNLLTVQVPSASPGLEVLDCSAIAHCSSDLNGLAASSSPASTYSAAVAAAANCGWVPVESLQGETGESFDLIVFAGAPLHRLTAGYYPACSHRVIAASGQTTRVSSVFKHKVADGALLRTQAVIDAARNAGAVEMSSWTARAAAVLQFSGGRDHPFLSLVPPRPSADPIEDIELRQLEVAAALHNLAEMRPDLLPTTMPEPQLHGAPESLVRNEGARTTGAAAAAGPDADQLRLLPVNLADGEKLGACVAADGTILGYTGENTVAELAGLPRGWQVVAVNGHPIHGLEELKQQLQATVPGVVFDIACVPRRRALQLLRCTRSQPVLVDKVKNQLHAPFYSGQASGQATAQP